MDTHIYALVKKNASPLTPEEQQDAAFEIRRSCDRILEMCYLHTQARALILDTLERTASLSKLGRDYNSAILGYNKSIQDRIEKLKETLPTVDLIAGSKLLVQANLHPRVVLNETVLKAVTNGPDCWQKNRVLSELDVLAHNRKLMVNAILNAAVEVALQKHKQLNNDVIQVSDLFQEAVKAAYDGTLLYNHSTKATWFTFAYSRMYDSIGNYIADRSRVVAIPRSTIERFNLVLKSIQHTKSIDPTTLAEHANKLLQDEKALEYSPDEIETILKSMQGNISLDFIIDDNSETGKHSLLDILSVETETEDTITAGFLKKNVGNVLKKLLSPLEFTIVDLLWGITTGEPKDLHIVSEEIKKIYPDKKISKARVRKTADRVLARLRKNPDLKSIWREL